MGARSSRPAGLVVSLDALGTLYKFREPVAVQYDKVARQNGFKASYTIDELKTSFGAAFKRHSRLFPNYGKGKLESPQEWWESLVHQTFSKFDSNVPPELGQRLYEHFTSSAAYQLYPDVRPFLEIMSELKSDFSDPRGPIVVTAAISNSDPRVRNILQSLGLRVGPSEVPKPDFMADMKTSWEGAKTGKILTPVTDFYNSGDHFNFLCTSYGAGFEKPDPRIFHEAARFPRLMAMSRSVRVGEDVQDSASAYETFRNAREVLRQGNDFIWIHIGDDYEKDYQGAKGYGLEALLLQRDGKAQNSEDSVSDLEQAGRAISILAHERLRNISE